MQSDNQPQIAEIFRNICIKSDLDGKTSAIDPKMSGFLALIDFYQCWCVYILCMFHYRHRMKSDQHENETGKCVTSIEWANVICDYEMNNEHPYKYKIKI